MTHTYFSRKLLSIVLLCFLVLATAVFLLFSGCAKNLSGDLKANSKPVVAFVNIPPDGQQFSRNPIVYWNGTDIDGTIAFYRYHVVTVADMGAMAPDAYIATIDSSEWVYLPVDPTGNGGQQTEVSIQLVADSLDPVLSFVEQYVFVQAYDNEGQSSDIVHRLFSRNDNPPQTVLFGSLSGTRDAPYVNAPTAGGVITGIRFNWQGTDLIDYPSDPPPFEFEWKLFGPFTDAEAATLRTQFVVKRFVTREGKVFDLGDTLIHCNDDSTDCDTVVVQVANAGRIATIFGADYGVFDSTFLATDPAFLASALHKVADSSFDGIDSWVTKTSDTIYNVFASASSPTTTQAQFIFWLRSRDDAKVPDLVPAFRFVNVINPRYERDVIVLDLTFRSNFLNRISGTTQGAAKKYFKQAMMQWNPTSDFDTIFDTLGGQVDYVTMGDTPSLLERRIPLSWLLSHKVMILFNDNAAPASLDKKTAWYSPIFTAIDGGVNAWVTARCPMSVGIPTGPSEATALIQRPLISDYTLYFGVLGMAYSGWFCHAFNYNTCAIARIEDFVGGISLLPGDPNWPDINVDSAKLGNPSIVFWGPNSTAYRYDDNGVPIDTFHLSLAFMGDAAHGVPGAPAVPEVNWSQRITPGTEGLYLYKSYYGNSHPLGGPYSMQGAPCAHRFNTGLYRTVHFNFTPIVMDSATMQQAFSSVMTWLIDPGATSPTAKIRYPDATIPMSKQAARQNYLRRVASDDAKYLEEHPEQAEIR